MSEETDDTTPAPKPAHFEFDFDHSKSSRDILRGLPAVLYGRIEEGPSEHDAVMKALVIDPDELNDTAVAKRLNTLEKTIAEYLQPWIGKWVNWAEVVHGDQTIDGKFRQMFDRFTDRYRFDLVAVLLLNKGLQRCVDESDDTLSDPNYLDATLPLVTPSGRALALAISGDVRDTRATDFGILERGSVFGDPEAKVALSIRLDYEYSDESRWFVKMVNEEFAALLDIPGVGVCGDDWEMPQEGVDEYVYRVVTEEDLAKIFELLDRPPQQT